MMPVVPGGRAVQPCRRLLRWTTTVLAAVACALCQPRGCSGGMTAEQARQFCEPYSALYENVHHDLSRWKEKVGLLGTARL